MHRRACPTHFLGQTAAARKDAHIQRTWIRSAVILRRRSDTGTIQEARRRSRREGTAFDLPSEDRRTARAPRSRHTFAPCSCSGRPADLRLGAAAEGPRLDRRARRQREHVEPGGHAAAGSGSGSQSEARDADVESQGHARRRDRARGRPPLLRPTAASTTPAHPTQRTYLDRPSVPRFLRARFPVRFVDSLYARRIRTGWASTGRDGHDGNIWWPCRWTHTSGAR